MDTLASLIPYLRGGKTAKDLEGLDGRFAGSLAALFREAPESVRAGLGINSAFRSPERQAQLFEQALAKYGSPEAARKWVAPPGRSQHNHGSAVDLAFGNDVARRWVHDNAAQYGLTFPMGHEPWHIEPAGARQRGPTVEKAAAMARSMAPTKENAAAIGLPDAPAAPNPAPEAPQAAPDAPGADLAGIFSALAAKMGGAGGAPGQMAPHRPVDIGSILGGVSKPLILGA